MTRFAVSHDRSTILISVRSTMGPVAFEGRDVRGTVDVAVSDGDEASVTLNRPPRAQLLFGLGELRSGNELYDAELRRRLDIGRYPECALTLHGATALGDDRYTLVGTIDFHGRTRQLSGTVSVEHVSAERIAVIGEKTLDIRDFGLSTPQMLLFRFYPEVTVQLFLDATAPTETGT